MAEPYPYADGDRFQDPEYYMYSKFGGHDFLEGYLRSREAALRTLKDRCADSVRQDGLRMMAPLVPFLNRLYPEIDAGPEPVRDEAPPLSSTAEALLVICTGMARDGRTDPDLMFYLGRFEVTKRLRTEYPHNGGTPPGDPDGVAAHGLLMLGCALHHELTGSLKTLNTLLKLGDLACSEAFADADGDSLYAAVCALTLESAHIRQLMREKEVACRS